jgi:hypothetical protein
MRSGMIRPQILVAIICGTVFGVAGMWIGMEMGATEIVTAVVGSVFGFLGGVSLKVLDQE